MSQRNRIGLICLLILGFIAGTVFIYRRVDPSAREKRFLDSANKYANEGKFREASIQFLNAINLNPSSGEAHRGLGHAALRLGDPDTAFFEFQQVTELNPADTDAHLQYGNLLLARGQVKEARKEAELVVAREAESADAHLLMAQVHLAAQELDQAESEIRRSQELNPKSAQPEIVLGGLRLRTGQLPEAEASYKKALDLNPNDIDAMRGLGTAYERQQRWSDAEAVYKRAMNAAPEDASPRVSLMVLYLFQGKTAQAEQVAREAKEKLPKVPAAYRMLADFYVATGQSKKGLDEISDVLKTHGNDWRLKRDYVQQLIFANRIDEATAINDELITLIGSNPPNLIQRGQIQLRSGKPDQAIVTLKTALRDDPTNPIGHFYLGVALGATGDNQGSERELRESMKLQPQGAQPQIFLSDLAARTGKLPLLDELSKRLIDAFPLSANSYLVRATFEASRNQYSAAEFNLRQAIQVEPKNPLGYGKLAELRFVQKDFNAGIDLLNQALAVDPNYTPAMKVLVAIDLSRNNLKGAIDRVQKQIENAPSNSAYHSMLGTLLIQQNRASDAIPEFKRALELDKKNGEAWELLGRTQASQGHLDQTISTYNQWALADTGQPNAHVLLGLIYEERGDWKKAQDEYQMALNINENSGIAANNLAYLLLEHGGDPAKAIGLAMVARRQLPNSPIALDTLGWAYYRDGQFALAATTLESAAKFGPKSASVQYHLGSAYHKLKDDGKAAACYQKVVTLDPKSAVADEARKALAELHSQVNNPIGK